MGGKAKKQQEKLEKRRSELLRRCGFEPASKSAAAGLLDRPHSNQLDYSGRIGCFKGEMLDISSYLLNHLPTSPTVTRCSSPLGRFCCVPLWPARQQRKTTVPALALISIQALSRPLALLSPLRSPLAPRRLQLFLLLSFSLLACSGWRLPVSQTEANKTRTRKSEGYVERVLSVVG